MKSVEQGYVLGHDTGPLTACDPVLKIVFATNAMSFIVMFYTYFYLSIPTFQKSFQTDEEFFAYHIFHGNYNI